METTQKGTRINTAERKEEKESICQQKQRIKAFDRELLLADEEKIFAYKFLYIFAGIFGTFLMIFPLDPSGNPDLRVLHVLAWMFLGMAVVWRIQPYVLLIGMDRVSKILAYTPVNQKLLRQVRLGYLHRYLLKLGAVCLVAQQAGALVNGTWSFWNLIYPIGMILSLDLAGSLYIGWK